jgi:N-acyl-D-aspartate/D-glutamate deacylase
MATQADLVTRVLQELNILVAGETPDASDDTVVDDAIAEVHAELQERQLAYWETTAIPESVMRGLTLMVAGNCGRKFVPSMPISECEAMRDQGMRRIREVIAMQSDQQPVPQNYF